MSEKTEINEKKANRNYFSPVWSYFRVCEDNAVLADCLLCGLRMTRGGTAPSRCGTTNLRRHILCAHNISLPSANKKETVDGSSKKHSIKKSLLKSPPVLKKNTAKKKTKELLKKIPLSQRDTKKKTNEIKEEIDVPVPQSEPVMCIKWNTYLSNMTSTLPNLMNDEQFVDVTLACEGQSLKCHKVLLAACSPYLHHLLTSANCPHPVIVFKDYCFWELQALVAFMYSGEVSVPQSQLPRILRVAESLQIKGLAKPATKSEPVEEDGPLWNELPETPVASSESLGTKRKRKPSSHNCCKNPPKASKFMAKVTSLVKPRKKRNSPKKKVVKQPPNMKLKISPKKKSSPKKCAQPEIPTSEEEIMLPELADMLSVDMLNTADIGEDIGLPLPAAHVDSIFSLPDFKVDGVPEVPEITPFLANGLHRNDLLHHITPECSRLDDDQDGIR